MHRLTRDSNLWLQKLDSEQKSDPNNSFPIWTHSALLQFFPHYVQSLFQSKFYITPSLAQITNLYLYYSYIQADLHFPYIKG